MGALLEVKVDAQPALEMMRIGAGRAIDLRPAMKDVGEHLKNCIRRNFDEEGRPKWPPSRKRRGQKRTLSRHGDLKRSIGYVAGANEVNVYAARVYAGVHEFGGEIRAKSGKFLAIPAPELPDTASPRDYGGRKDVFFIRFGDKLAMAMAPQSKRGKPKRLFTLVKKVKIPARSFLTVPPEELQQAADKIIEYVWEAL